MALRYWVTGGTGDYNSTTNWSTASGGASGASVPTTADDAVWDVNSGSGTVVINVASVALSVDFTDFTGTVDFQNTLSVNGSITLGVGMSFANTTGTPLLRITGTLARTLTSNGVIFPYDFSIFIGNGGAITVADDWEVRDMRCDSGLNIFMNGNRFYVNGNLTHSSPNANQPVRGTTVFEMKGTGTISCPLNNGGGFSNVTINTAGTITLVGTCGPGIREGVWTYTAGTVITTGSTFRFGANLNTFDLDGIIFENILFNGGITTLLSDLVYTTNFSTPASITTNSGINGFSIRHVGTGNFYNGIGAGFNLTGLGGSSILSFEGSGNIECQSKLAKPILKPIVINTTGTYTLIGRFDFRGSTFTYTAGNIIDNCIDNYTFGTYGNETTTFNGVSPLFFKGIAINHSQSTTTPKIVLNDTFNCENIYFGTTNVSSSQFLGTHGFSCNTLHAGTGGTYAQLLKEGITYQVNNLFTTNNNTGTGFTLASVTTGQKAFLKLMPGAEQVLRNLNFRDIDATPGQTIWVHALPANSTITDCLNINKFTKPRPVGI